MAKPEKIRGLLDPGVRFRRGVHRKFGPPAKTFRSHVPTGFRGPRCEEAHEVGHVAAAHEQSSTVGRKSDQLRNPSHRLLFDFGGDR